MIPAEPPEEVRALKPRLAALLRPHAAALYEGAERSTVGTYFGEVAFNGGEVLDTFARRDQIEVYQRLPERAAELALSMWWVARRAAAAEDEEAFLRAVGFGDDVVKDRARREAALFLVAADYLLNGDPTLLADAAAVIAAPRRLLRRMAELVVTVNPFIIVEGRSALEEVERSLESGRGHLERARRMVRAGDEKIYVLAGAAVCALAIRLGATAAGLLPKPDAAERWCWSVTAATALLTRGLRGNLRRIAESAASKNFSAAALVAIAEQVAGRVEVR